MTAPHTVAGHTAGPWRFERHPAGTQWLGNIMGSYGLNERGIEQVRTITCQTRYESYEGEAEANARLIAAAPDLLEPAPDAADLLEHYAEFIRTVKADELERHPYLPHLEQVATSLRAAIAKATAARQSGEDA